MIYSDFYIEINSAFDLYCILLHPNTTQTQSQGLVYPNPTPHLSTMLEKLHMHKYCNFYDNGEGA